MRNGLDRLNVGGHVFADLAVTSGGSTDQAAALVEQAHGQPVDLELAGVSDLAGDEAVHALGPGQQVFVTVGLVERHHRREMPDLREER